jgi:ketosteroid isomerase-like protein
MLKSVLILLVGLLVTEPFARCQAASATDEQLLRGIEVETARFEQRNDPAIAKYLADDWVCVDQRRTLSKKEFVENVKQNFATHENGVNPYTIEKKNLQVHIFGNTAVVTYVKEYRQTPDTTKGFSEDDTDVFVRDAGRWRVRFTKIAPVRMQTAAN